MKKLLTEFFRSFSGGSIVAAGIVFFVTGLLLRRYFPGTVADSRLLEGFGILLFGWGTFPFIRHLLHRRNPTQTRRAMLSENDERAVELRNKAGFFAYAYSVVITSVVLITYSALTRGEPGPDPVWFTLIFLSITPVLVFTGILMWLNRE